MTIATSTTSSTNISFMMTDFKKIGDMHVGKNGDPINGVYTLPGNTEHNYFIKFPDDEIETINEFLTGKLFEAMVHYQLIDDSDRDLLITTDLIFDPQTGKTGLIQPFLDDATPLHQALGNTSPSGSGRSVFLEMGPIGRDRYAYAVTHHQERIAKILAISLTFGDYSLHSDNMVLTQDDTKVCKIDHGAAMRYMHLASNNIKLDHPLEYQEKPHKHLTKAYHKKYMQDQAIVDCISEFGQHLDETMSGSQITMDMLVEYALLQLPQLWRQQLITITGAQLEETETEHQPGILSSAHSHMHQLIFTRDSQTSACSRYGQSNTTQPTLTQIYSKALKQRLDLVKGYQATSSQQKLRAVGRIAKEVQQNTSDAALVPLTLLLVGLSPLILAVATLVMTAYLLFGAIQTTANFFREETQPAPAASMSHSL